MNESENTSVVEMKQLTCLILKTDLEWKYNV